jgi:hypothetical protein
MGGGAAGPLLRRSSEGIDSAASFMSTTGRRLDRNGVLALSRGPSANRRRARQARLLGDSGSRLCSGYAGCREIGRFGPEKGVRSTWGRYRPLLLESLAWAPGGQDLPLADLTGRFVQSDGNAVYKQGLS